MTKWLKYAKLKCLVSVKIGFIKPPFQAKLHFYNWDFITETVYLFWLHFDTKKSTPFRKARGGSDPQNSTLAGRDNRGVSTTHQVQPRGWLTEKEKRERNLHRDPRSETARGRSEHDRGRQDGHPHPAGVPSGCSDRRVLRRGETPLRCRGSARLPPHHGDLLGLRSSRQSGDDQRQAVHRAVQWHVHPLRDLLKRPRRRPFAEGQTLHPARRCGDLCRPRMPGGTGCRERPERQRLRGLRRRHGRHQEHRARRHRRLGVALTRDRFFIPPEPTSTIPQQEVQTPPTNNRRRLCF